MAYDPEYKKLITDLGLKPLTYKEIADDWEANTKEWYHAMISIEDLPIVLAIPNLKVYSWCRCKLVANDGSESHFHWHGLVHFQTIKFLSWKKQAHRTNVKFVSSKNTFKKIICLDHAVGVLRYLACADGKTKKSGRRDDDGLLSHPHTHYSRQPIDENHRHKRGKQCPDVRNEISENIASHLNLDGKLNWNSHNLHNVETCTCDRGEIGKKKREAANEKRRAFYKTDAGIEVRRKYREKPETKARLIDELCKLNVSKRSELSLETIKSLVNKLQ